MTASYRIAVNEALPPASLDYMPRDQMMVISLGRLGMNEFDLGSDADLVFVLPDADAAELPFWTGVAERMIQTISSYTGEGVMFTVDTRLRPNGREGDLVQLEGALQELLRTPCRGLGRHHVHEVARGGRQPGTRHRVSARAAGRGLAALRAEHAVAQGSGGRCAPGWNANRVRAIRSRPAPGGYYDIDFALMYLRLKGAGIFYKVLNTPERIDVIEKMGHLEREDADFLREAATFYRALDHGQRVSTGHAEGSLPSAQSQFEVLTNLVKRWTPEHLHGQRIDATLREIRGRTRDFFHRLFGK